jgi:hypothetical protein
MSFSKSLRRSSAALFLIAVLVQSVTFAAPDPSDIADFNSFGRSVIYLGVAGTPTLVFRNNCTIAPPPAPTRCVTMNPQPALTPFTETKLATLTIPAKSTNSLLCFALTPSINFQLHNLTGAAQPTARFGARTTVVLENPLLNDPSLIDPITGLPFNGKINLSLATYSESRSMASGERDQKQFFFSRHCIDGVISKQSLEINYGLPPTVVDNFFKNDITLTFGAAGDLQLVSSGTYYYGIRIYGDAP